MNLNDRALLVQMSISQWSARKFDKKATKDIAVANNVSENVGRYNKALLPMNDLLDNVHKKSSHIRTKFYENTLPWGIEGTMMLPTANYLAFMTEFRKEKSEWELLVNRFVFDYSRLKADAQRLLGNMYNESDYPTVNEIKDKFKMDIAIFPVPSSDFRVAIASDELSRIQQDVEERVKTAQSTAMNEAWQRLYDRVKNMAEKLSDPTAIFRDSLIENTRELCALLPRLNFSDDPHLEDMRKEVESKLFKHPEALRNNPDLRKDTASEAKAIMDKMASFMGGNK